MVRLGLSCILVLSITAAAMANNGARKIRGFEATEDANDFEQDVDGVGVIKHTKGNQNNHGENNLHVVLTNLEPGVEYEFQPYAVFVNEHGETEKIQLFNDPGAGSFVANPAGNGQGKTFQGGSDVTEFVDLVEVTRNGVVIAVSTVITD